MSAKVERIQILWREPIERRFRDSFSWFYTFAAGSLVVAVGSDVQRPWLVAALAYLGGMGLIGLRLFLAPVLARLGINTVKRCAVLVTVSLAALAAMGRLAPHAWLQFMYGIMVLGHGVMPLWGILLREAAVARAAAPLTPKLSRAPGSGLRRFLSLFLTPHVIGNIVDPVLADLHAEWIEAAAGGRIRLWTIRLRAYLFVLQHLAYAAWRAFKD